MAFTEETTFRLGRLLFIVGGTVAVLAVLAIALVSVLNGAASHYVTVTNDTKAAIHWDCSWSSLRLAPGSTGRIRIQDQPDQDFGCNTGPRASDADLCPPVSAMTVGHHFTVSYFKREFVCI